MKAHSESPSFILSCLTNTANFVCLFVGQAPNILRKKNLFSRVSK